MIARSPRARRTTLALGPALTILTIVATVGCGEDPCEALCPAATARLEACFDPWGVTWGPAVGYDDAEDHLNWCRTWAEEERLLARTSSDPGAAHDALDARCADIDTALGEEDCDGYWALFTR